MIAMFTAILFLLAMATALGTMGWMLRTHGSKMVDALRGAHISMDTMATDRHSPPRRAVPQIKVRSAGIRPVAADSGLLHAA